MLSSLTNPNRAATGGQPSEAEVQINCIYLFESESHQVSLGVLELTV